MNKAYVVILAIGSLFMFAGWFIQLNASAKYDFDERQFAVGGWLFTIGVMLQAWSVITLLFV